MAYLKTLGTGENTYDVFNPDNLPIAEDAPSDDKQYARKNGEWDEVDNSGGAWGEITGDISDQTDLQNALNAKGNRTVIAHVESSMTATENYVIGDLISVGDNLYRVTSNIASGSSITVGSNAVATTIEAEMHRLYDELDDKKADIDGAYDDLVAGTAKQLLASTYAEDENPYLFRTSGGTADIGNRETNTVVGGTVVWNQLVTTDTPVAKTVSDDMVHVEDAVAGNVAELKTTLDPVQDLHGYDAPWPAGGGKNLWNDYEEPIPVSPDTWYVMRSDTLPNSGVSRIRFKIYDSNGDLIDQGASTATGSHFYMTTYTGILILSGDATSLTDKRFKIVDAPDLAYIVPIDDTQTAYNYTHFTNIQLEQGETSTSYAPYENICPISGHTSAIITRSKKNLLPTLTGASNNGLTSTVNADGSITISGRATGTGGYITSLTMFNRIKAGTTVTIGFGVSLPERIRCFFKNETGVSNNVTWDVAATKSSYSNTLPKDIYGLLLYFSTTANTDYNFTIYPQLELGSTATTYEAYQGQSVTIALGDTYYGGTLDVLTGTLTVDREIVTLIPNGKDPTSENFWYTSAISNLNEKNDGVICNKLPVISNVYAGTTESGICWFTNGIIRWVEAGTMDMSLDNYKTYLQTNPLIATYRLPSPQTVTLSPNQLSTLLGENNIWSDTGTVTVTYNATTNEITAVSGHRYLTKINGTETIQNGTGSTISAQMGRDNVFDLTHMFGKTIADYIYSLTDGVSWFRNLFPKAYYQYDPGSFLSVSNLVSHDTVGFNAWDEVWELGNILDDDGVNSQNTTLIRSKNYIPAFPETEYYAYIAGKNAHFFCYDSEKNYLGYVARNNNGTFTTLAKTAYIRFRMNTAYGTTYKNDICINLSWSGWRDGEYEAYSKHSYSLDSSLTLRGMPKLDAHNNLYYDGDSYEASGKVTRKYGIVDLGSITGTNGWTWNVANQGCFSTDAIVMAGGNNIICSKYPNLGLKATSSNISSNDYFIRSNKLQNGSAETGNFNYNALIIKDTSFNGDLDAFVLAMSGVYLIYELDTPTTETAAPFADPQIVDDFGTEAYIVNSSADAILPVGHHTKFLQNLRDKVQHLPNLAEEDGTYIIEQSDKKMELVPFTLGTMASKNDAASDDAQYVRKNGAWEDLAPTLQNKATIIEETVTDSLVHITDGSANPVKALSVSIEPVQDLHGYDNPWPAGGGKNLLKTAGLTYTPPSDTSWTNTSKRTFGVDTYSYGVAVNNYYSTQVESIAVSENSIKFTSQQGGYGVNIPVYNLTVGETYTISATATNGGFGCVFYQEDGTYISNVSGTTFTIPADTNFVLLCFRPTTAGTESTFTNIQLEQGSTATSYAPYSNICPISGHTQAVVTRTGRNLFQPTIVNDAQSVTRYDVTLTLNAETGFYHFQGTANGGGGRGYLRSKDFLLKAGAYYLEKYGNTTDLNVIIQKGSSYLAEGNFTLTEDTYINVGFNVIENKVYNHDIAVVISPDPITSQTYQPADIASVTIALGQTIYGGTLDILTGTLTIDKVILTSTNIMDELTTWSSTYWSNAVVCRATGVDYRTVTICSMAEVVPYPGGPAPVGKICYAYNSTNDRFQIGFAKDYVWGDSAQTVKQWLTDNANDFRIVCGIATPTVITGLTPAQMSMLLGENNVWADTGATSLTYNADTKMYIDEQIAASTKATRNLIVGVEDAMKATKNYTTGQYLIVGDDLYKVTSNIASGVTISVGTNVSKTTVGEQLLLALS